MKIKLVKVDAAWTIIHNQRAVGVRFELEGDGWALESINVPYNDRFGDCNDDHTKAIDLWIDGEQYELTVEWDGKISSIVKRIDSYNCEGVISLDIPVEHAASGFFKPSS